MKLENLKDDTFEICPEAGKIVLETKERIGKMSRRKIRKVPKVKKPIDIDVKPSEVLLGKLQQKREKAKAKIDQEIEKKNQKRNEKKR